MKEGQTALPHLTGLQKMMHMVAFFKRQKMPQTFFRTAEMLEGFFLAKNAKNKK